MFCTKISNIVISANSQHVSHCIAPFDFRMDNIIQELRGNVQVFAQIRPFVPNDGKQGKEDSAATLFVSHVGDSTVTVVSDVVLR